KFTVTVDPPHGGAWCGCDELKAKQRRFTSPPRLLRRGRCGVSPHVAAPLFLGARENAEICDLRHSAIVAVGAQSKHAPSVFPPSDLRKGRAAPARIMNLRCSRKVP